MFTTLEKHYHHVSGELHRTGNISIPVLASTLGMTNSIPRSIYIVDLYETQYSENLKDFSKLQKNQYFSISVTSRTK